MNEEVKCCNVLCPYQVQDGLSYHLKYIPGTCTKFSTPEGVLGCPTLMRKFPTNVYFPKTRVIEVLQGVLDEEDPQRLKTAIRDIYRIIMATELGESPTEVIPEAMVTQEEEMPQPLLQIEKNSSENVGCVVVFLVIINLFWWWC